MTAFHEVRFPPAISLASTGGPERRTEIVTLGSGFEERNQRWADSRRNYNAGYGVKSIGDLHAVIEFFEERRGQLTAFRWKDWADYKSCAPDLPVSAFDQVIGAGGGEETQFQLIKTYGSVFAPWTRTIVKPVPGSVLIAVAGVPMSSGWSVDTATGIVTFASAPADEAAITAGFEFDVPARFATDKLETDFEGFALGSIPRIPIIEVKL